MRAVFVTWEGGTTGMNKIYKKTRMRTEGLAHSEQLLCSPGVNFCNLNCNGRMINTYHITN